MPDSRNQARVQSIIMTCPTEGNAQTRTGLQEPDSAPDLLPIPVTARKAEPRLALTIGVTGWVTSCQDFQVCPLSFR